MNLLFCTAKVPVRLSSANRVVSQIVLFRILVNCTLSRETYCGVHVNAGFEVDLPKSFWRKERDDLSRTGNSWITQLDGRTVLGTADGTFDHNV